MKKICILLLAVSTIPFFCHAEENRYDHLIAKTIEEIQTPPQDKSRQRLGIAFGAGGVRGFAHLGVIKALEEEGIRPDIVVGASAGSIVASLYAAGLNYQEMREIADQLNQWQAIKDMTVSSKGFFQGKSIARRVNKAIKGSHKIEQLPTFPGITITDLNKRQTLLVVEGDVGEAVQTSCSIPGSFIPVQHNDAVWVDGGILAAVPVDFARKMGADIVVGVDIYCHNMPTKPRDNILASLIFNQRLLICKNSEAEIGRADILIPTGVEPKDETDFTKREEAIAAGYQATMAIMPQLKAILSEKIH